MVDRKYGRRPPKNAKAMRFARVADALTPLSYPSVSDATVKIPVDSWQMLWNDSWGDCVVVSWSSIRRVITSLYTTENYVTDEDSILKLYRTQNPDFDPNGDSTNGPGSRADGGMDIQTLLEYLVKEDGPDGVKALAFAKVDHTNVDELKAALSIFKVLWLGVVVTGDDEQEFPAQAWTRSGRALGGHSIIDTGYNPSEFYIQTWGDEGFLTNDFVVNGNEQAGVEEAWLVIWPEHAERLTDEQKRVLDDEYATVTNGKHIKWPTEPTPEPTPVPPTPSPTPTPAPKDIPQEVLDWLKHLPRYNKNIWHWLKGYLGQ